MCVTFEQLAFSCPEIAAQHSPAALQVGAFLCQMGVLSGTRFALFAETTRFLHLVKARRKPMQKHFIFTSNTGG
jgi:hypothetical protein